MIIITGLKGTRVFRVSMSPDLCFCMLQEVTTHSLTHSNEYYVYMFCLSAGMPFYMFVYLCLCLSVCNTR